MTFKLSNDTNFIRISRFFKYFNIQGFYMFFWPLDRDPSANIGSCQKFFT